MCVVKRQKKIAPGVGAIFLGNDIQVVPVNYRGKAR